MKKFKYRGYDAQAVEQIGTLEAENYSEAYAALSYQGVTVVKLEPAQASFGQIAENFWLKLKLGGQWLGFLPRTRRNARRDDFARFA